MLITSTTAVDSAPSTQLIEEACIDRCIHAPLEVEGDGGEEHTGDEITVGNEHVGTHAGVQGQFGQHVHAGEA